MHGDTGQREQICKVIERGHPDLWMKSTLPHVAHRAAHHLAPGHASGLFSLDPHAENLLAASILRFLRYTSIFHSGLGASSSFYTGLSSLPPSLTPPNLHLSVECHFPREVLLPVFQATGTVHLQQ